MSTSRTKKRLSTDNVSTKDLLERNNSYLEELWVRDGKSLSELLEKGFTKFKTEHPNEDIIIQEIDSLGGEGAFRQFYEDYKEKASPVAKDRPKYSDIDTLVSCRKGAKSQLKILSELSRSLEDGRLRFSTQVLLAQKVGELGTTAKAIEDLRSIVLDAYDFMYDLEKPLQVIEERYARSYFWKVFLPSFSIGSIAGFVIGSGLLASVALQSYILAVSAGFGVVVGVGIFLTCWLITKITDHFCGASDKDTKGKTTAGNSWLKAITWGMSATGIVGTIGQIIVVCAKLAMLATGSLAIISAGYVLGFLIFAAIAYKLAERAKRDSVYVPSTTKGKSTNSSSLEEEKRRSSPKINPALSANSATSSSSLFGKYFSRPGPFHASPPPHQPSPPSAKVVEKKEEKDHRGAPPVQSRSPSSAAPALLPAQIPPAVASQRQAGSSGSGSRTVLGRLFSIFSPSPPPAPSPQIFPVAVEGRHQAAAVSGGRPTLFAAAPSPIPARDSASSASSSSSSSSPQGEADSDQLTGNEPGGVKVIDKDYYANTSGNPSQFVS